MARRGLIRVELTDSLQRGALPVMALSPGTRYFFLLLYVCAACTWSQPYTERPLVLAHYMPWYASEPVSGAWGWHWTMEKFQPGHPDNPTVAAHDPPLAGPYDSSDQYLIEYHLALMKLAGIDGIIVDWYGTSDFRDYRFIHECTEQLLTATGEAGLLFAVCYEDQSVKHQVEAGELAASDAMRLGTSDLVWLRDVAFPSPNYLTLRKQPILPIFGPQFFGKEDWEMLRATFPEPTPILYGLPHLTAENGIEGIMGWPPVHGGSDIVREAWTNYCASLEERFEGGEPLIPTVFPGFRDIYQEAGLHDSYGFIDPREGSTLRETLDHALRSGAPIVQIATWNDFGEGTAIEPTREAGYRSLEIIQQRLNPEGEPEDLRFPLQLYRARQEHRNDAEMQRLLDLAAEALLAGRVGIAKVWFQDALKKQAQRTADTNDGSK